MAEPASDGGAPRLEVEFEPGSAFAELVASGPRVALEPVAGVGEIEVAVQRRYRERAVLALDPDALGVLLARIEADPEVQYAQPNVRMAVSGRSPRRRLVNRIAATAASGCAPGLLRPQCRQRPRSLRTSAAPAPSA